MSLRENKLIVLRQLSQESGPISLPELLRKLGESFKARSLRRWLSELVRDHYVQKMGQKRGTKYLILKAHQTKEIDAGCDVIRVRYRQQRRKIIREIILDGRVGESLTWYIQRETSQLIPSADRAAFLEDLHEDLHLINDIRLAGLGVTPHQLRDWLQLRQTKNLSK